MARRRSPNYPGISLGEAVQRIDVLHRIQGQTPEPRDVVARHLGFGGLNGAALKILSGLLKYGLLDDVGDGTCRVTDTAIQILAPEGEEQKRRAVETAAFSFPLFAEIRERWDGRMPSQDSLRAFLVRRHFSESAIESVWESYKGTHDLVTLETSAYPESSPDDEGEGNRNTAGPTSDPAPRPQAPSARRPFEVTITDRITGRFSFENQEDVDALVSVLNANKILLPSSRDPDESN